MIRRGDRTWPFTVKFTGQLLGLCRKTRTAEWKKENREAYSASRRVAYLAWKEANKDSPMSWREWSGWSHGLRITGKLDVGEPSDPVVPTIAPPEANQSVGYLTTRDGHGAPQGGVPIIFRVSDAPSDSYNNGRFTVVSGTDGTLLAVLPRLTTVMAKRGPWYSKDSEWVEFAVPDEDPVELPAILESP